MNALRSGLGNYIAAHLWRTIGFALLYCVLLACVFSTISLSEEQAARQYIAQAMSSPPEPLSPLPIVHELQWPDITLRRDPFQPLATPANKPQSSPNHSAAPTTRRVRVASLPDIWT